MACFYVFVENTVPMAIGRTGGLSERLRNALANILPDQKLNIFPAFLPFNILFPVHCFASGEIPFCILYFPTLCSFSVFGPAAIMAVHPVIQILTVPHIISVQRFTINDVDKIFHKKKHLTNEVLLQLLVENTVPMAIGRTSGLSERLRNALANILPDQKLNIFPAFLPFNILFPSHCFASGEIPFYILYLPILCSFSVCGPATIMAVHPILQILTVPHIISVQRFTINDVDKIFHKKKAPHK